MKENKCIICDSKNLLYILRKDGYNFYRCNQCGLIYVHPQPSLNQLIRDYYSSISGYHSELPRNLGEIKKHKKRFIEILDRLDKYKIKGNLLDVGCSNGEFLFLARQRGFNTYGVEINKETAEIAVNNELDVFNGTLEDANFQNNFFSVIHLGDVIEHILDPIDLLKECRRILRKDGIIIISTPNLDCFWTKATYLLYRWFRFPWSVLIPPYHLFLFSQHNFKKLLYRMKFKVLNIGYQRCFLRHELGSTGLFRQIREKKSFKFLSYSLFVFLIYTFVYFIDFLITPFKDKDFEMTIFAQNNL